MHNRRLLVITVMALLLIVVLAQHIQADLGLPPMPSGRVAESALHSPSFAEIPIRTTTANEAAPAVAFGSRRNEYLVVWREITGSQAAVRAQRIDATGFLIGPVILVSESDPGTNGAYAAVAYNSFDDEYLIVWDRWFPSGFNGGIAAQRLAANGVKLGTNFWILDRHWGEVRPDVAFLPDRAEYLVAWHDYRYPPGGTRGNIFGRRLSRSGELIGTEISIVEIDGNQWTPKVAAISGGDAYVVTWVDARNGNDVPLIFAKRLSGNGATVGPEVRVDEGGMGHWYPAVIYSPIVEEVLVAWQDHRVPDTPRASVKRFSASLTPLAPSQAPRVGISHGRPALAFNSLRGEYYLAWMEGEPHQVGGQRWSLAGQPIGTPAIVAARPYGQSAPVLAASTNNGNFLLVWEDDRQGTGNADIYGVLLADDHATETPTITPTSTFTPSPTATRTPTPSSSPTPTLTPTASVTPTPTLAPTSTPTATRSASPTPTVLPSQCSLYEPNDTLDIAAGPMGNNQQVIAALCPGDLDDFYFIDLSDDTREIDVQLSNLAGALDADLYLYDPNDAIVSRSTQPGVSSERILYNPLVPGRYTLRVHPVAGWNTTPYLLVIRWYGVSKHFLPLLAYDLPPTFTPTPTPSPTATRTATATSIPSPTATPTPDPCQQFEPNNTLGTAFGPLPSGAVIEAALCNGDPDDYYQVVLSGPATLQASLHNLPAGTDYDLYLYDVNAPSQYLVRSVNAGTDPEFIQIGLLAGRYVLRIYPSMSGRSSEPYRLTLWW